jgi:hypothetical protein
MTDSTTSASAPPGFADFLEDWRQAYMNSGDSPQERNGLWVWWAINLCTSSTPPEPLPGWVVEYLRDASDRLMAIAECLNPRTMPAPTDFESLDDYSAARASWIHECRKVVHDPGARAAFWEGARDLAIEVLQLHSPKRNHFKTIGTALKQYLAALGADVLGEKRWLATQRGKSVQDGTLRGHAREGRKMFPLLTAKRTMSEKS